MMKSLCKNADQDDLKKVFKLIRELSPKMNFSAYLYAIFKANKMLEMEADIMAEILEFDLNADFWYDEKTLGGKLRAQWEAEGLEKGIEKGIEKGVDLMVKLLHEGLSLEEATQKIRSMGGTHM